MIKDGEEGDGRGEDHMRNVTKTELASSDGVVESPEGWVFPYSDEIEEEN
jgi:hypothetical protein